MSAKRKVSWMMLEGDLLILEEWAVERHSGMSFSLRRKTAAWNVCSAVRELRERVIANDVLKDTGKGAGKNEVR